MPRNRILPVFIPHLGCPNNCVFCDQNRISGCAVPADGNTVRSACDQAKRDGLSGLELALYGGSFTAVDPLTQEALLKAAQPYLADGTLRAVRLSTRPDAVDGDALTRLRRYGVSTVELGAQSMDDAVLLASGRGHTAADTENAARRLRAAGFHVVLQMMTGLPGADAKSDIRTAERLAALRPDGVRVYPTVIMENTPLAALWRSGAYAEHTVADAVAVCADILDVFEAADIPVIRLGLNPTDTLSGGAAIGGAYHPALGELVRSERMRRKAAAMLSDAGVSPGASVVLGVNPRRVSAMTGQHRSNVRALTERFSLASLRIRPAELPGDTIAILSVQ